MLAQTSKNTGDVALRLKVKIGDVVIGPGKIELLRRIQDDGGISAAARSMGMSYRRAWHLIDTLSAAFCAPIVETAVGGSGGGGATLTPVGERLVREYQAAIDAASTAASPYLDWLDEVSSSTTDPV